MLFRRMAKSIAIMDGRPVSNSPLRSMRVLFGRMVKSIATMDGRPVRDSPPTADVVGAMVEEEVGILRMILRIMIMILMVADEMIAGERRRRSPRNPRRRRVKRRINEDVKSAGRVVAIQGIVQVQAPTRALARAQTRSRMIRTTPRLVRLKRKTMGGEGVG